VPSETWQQFHNAQARQQDEPVPSTTTESSGPSVPTAEQVPLPKPSTRCPNKIPGRPTPTTKAPVQAQAPPVTEAKFKQPPAVLLQAGKVTSAAATVAEPLPPPPPPPKVASAAAPPSAPSAPAAEPAVTAEPAASAFGAPIPVPLAPPQDPVMYLTLH
jgi:hypothetical protein